MEEEKFTPAEQSDKPLSKEEILERSRKENDKAGDERERKLISYGIVIMLGVGLLFVLIIYFVNVFYLNKRGQEFLAIFFIMSSINFIWQGIFRKKLRVLNLIAGILLAVAGIVNFIMWIVTLTV